MKRLAKTATLFLGFGALALGACSEGADYDLESELATAAVDFDRENHPGKPLYEANCAACHSGTVAKAPHFDFLGMMSPASIHMSMDGGIMSTQAANLSEEERIEVVEYITQREIESIEQLALIKPPMCESDETSQFDLSKPAPAVGWGHDTARFSNAAAAGLDAKSIPDLELKWAFAFPESQRARSQPTIAMGAVFVGSQDGRVYAFDLETGCARWTFNARAEVRTAIVLQSDESDTVSADDPPLAFFGDFIGNLYAVNALTGELAWTFDTTDHPNGTLTGAPAYHDGHLYVPVSSLEPVTAANPEYECCTFRGKVIKVEAATGKVLWEHYSVLEEPVVQGKTSIGTTIIGPSGAPIWNSPAIDAKRGLLYVGTGENYSSPADGNSDAVLAINMATGRREWTNQLTAGDAFNVGCFIEDNPNCPEEDGPDLDIGASIIVLEQPDGKDILIVGRKTGEVFGLDPENSGKIRWTSKVGRGSLQGGVHFGMASDGTRVYVPIYDTMGSLWDHEYLEANRRQGGPQDPVPGMHAVDARDGKLLWSSVQENVCPEELRYCEPGISAAVTAMPGAVFAGHLDGFLRAYAQGTGELLWEYDTKAKVVGVNGIEGHGGSMSGAGPAIGDGYVVTNSGYSLYSHQPGNLLLVFASR